MRISIFMDYLENILTLDLLNDHFDPNVTLQAMWLLMSNITQRIF